MSAPTFTREQKRKGVERELGYRRRVYANRVTEGKMRQEQADHEIALFEAILADYTDAPVAVAQDLLAGGGGR